MSNLSIAVNATSLVSPRFPLWSPAIETFIKEKAEFLYIDPSTPQNLLPTIEAWTKQHAPHITFIYNFDDLQTSKTQYFISFEPPQNDQFKSLKKIQCWAVDTANFEESLKLCLSLSASIIFTDHLVEELPKPSNHYNLLVFENLFQFIPPCLPSIALHQKQASTAVFLYNSTDDQHLENFLPALKSTKQLRLVDLAKEKNLYLAIVEAIQNHPLTIIGFQNPQWIFFAKLLSAYHKLSVTFWSEAHLSIFRQLAFGIQPMNHRKRSHLLEESLADRLNRLTAPLHPSQDRPTSITSIFSDEVFNDGLSACLPSTITSSIEKKLTQLSNPLSLASSLPTYHEWVLFSTYGDHPEFPWWHFHSSFVSIDWMPPAIENPVLLRLIHTFLEAFEREPFDSKIRPALGAFRNNLYQSYIRQFLLHEPSNEWLQHFSRCYFRFADWIPASEKAVTEWYAESSKNKGANTLIAIGIVEGVLGAHYKTSPENILIKKAEQLINKDFDFDRINWKFASHRGLIHLIQGHPDQATNFINKIYTMDTQVKDGFSRLASHIECKNDILQAIQWYDEDFRVKRQTLPYQLKYLKLLAKHKYLEKAFEVIETIYKENTDKKVLGLEAAIHFFHPNWYALYEPNKRSALASQAKKCLQFLQLDRDYNREDVSNYALEAYWRLYSLDFDCIEDIYTKLEKNLGSTTSYASRTALILWALGQTSLAKKIIERESLSELKHPNDIHHYAVANALLGHRDLAKNGFHKLHSEHKHYFTTSDDAHPYKWFYQALAYKAVYATDKAERFLAYAREWDPLIHEAKVLLERTHPQIDEPDIIPHFPEPQLISII